MHREALTEEGLKIFPNLARFKNMYLAGGTALALQLGHRISADFDMFSDSKIPTMLLDTVRRVMNSSSVAPSVNNPDELTVFVDAVKVTFLYYPFPLIDVLVELQGVRAAGIREIAVMKAYTIGRRASYKDYVDLYVLLSSGHITLEQLIQLANQKYKEQFNDRLFLEQLVSLEDVTDEEIQFVRQPIGRQELTALFEKSVRSLRLE